MLRGPQQLVLRGGTAIQQFGDSGVDQVLAGAVGGGLRDGADGFRHPESLSLFELIIRELCHVESQRRMPPAKPGRNRQVDLGGIGDTEIVDSECGGVGHHREPLTPQRPPDEIILFTRKVDELPKAINAAIDTDPVAALYVEVLRLIGVAVLKSLGRGEVTTLMSRPTPEPHPRLVPLRIHTLQRARTNRSF